MSATPEILNLVTICRCCHADGYFKDLCASYRSNGEEEIYSELLQKTLDISIRPPPIEASYTICDECIQNLLDAARFKKQILLCEQKFAEYCKNELTTKLLNEDGFKTDVSIRNELAPGFDDESVLIETKSGTHYPCKTCGNSYASVSSLKRHVLKLHSNSYKCNKCPESFSTLNALRSHSKTHAKITCSHCSKEFKSQQAFINHINFHTKTTSFVCDYCSKEFGNKSSFRVHIKGHLGTKKVCVCYLCGRMFNDVTNMAIHIRTVHEKLRPFNCHLCPETFTAKKHLIVHIRKHTGEKPFQCAKCSKWYYTLWESNNHRCGERKYRCKVCAKEFSRRGALAGHLKRSHIGEKPFICSVCGKDFTCRYSMRRHEMTHSGIKPYACDICSMKFSQKAMVSRHLSRVHPGPGKEDKRISNQCHICKRVVLDMQKHNSKCHSDSKLVCDVCQKSYAQVAALNRHRRVVHLGIVYKCDYCSKKYQQRNKLVKHHLEVHNVSLKTELGFGETNAK